MGTEGETDDGDLTEIAVLEPAVGFLEIGATMSTTPALQVMLSHAAASDFLVSLSYSDPEIVSGPANLMMNAGEQSIELTLTAGGSLGAATVTASDGTNEFTSEVRVYDPMAARQIESLTPATQTLAPGSVGSLTVQLDAPAGVGGVSVALSTTPGLTAPASVTVPEKEVRADFNVAAGGTASVEMVIAQLGGDVEEAEIVIGD